MLRKLILYIQRVLADIWGRKDSRDLYISAKLWNRSFHMQLRVTCTCFACDWAQVAREVARLASLPRRIVCTNTGKMIIIEWIIIIKYLLPKILIDSIDVSDMYIQC